MSHQKLFHLPTLSLVVCLAACNPATEPPRALSSDEALADCQAHVADLPEYTAKKISEKDVADGYTLTGYILASCMAKHHYRCQQASASDPCQWEPMAR